MKALMVALSLTLALGLAAGDADAAKKKKKSAAKPQEISKSERARIYEWARKECRKEHGPTSRVQIDWAQKRYWCYIGG